MPVDYTVPAIDRALRLLEILSTSPEGRSLAQLAEDLRVPKSSLFRILYTLQQHTIVNEDRERKLFTLGMRLLDWGHAALSRIDLKSIAHPHLLKLAHETRESFYLAILDQDEVVLIDHVDTPEVWKMVTRLGTRSPVHCTATGLILIADLEEQDVEGIISRRGLKRFTGTTITTRVKLLKRLKEIRQKGFSIVDGEYKEELCAIAVPVRDHSGRVVSSLMTAIPSERYKKNKKHALELLKVLQRQSTIISKRIGHDESKRKS